MYPDPKFCEIIAKQYRLERQREAESYRLARLARAGHPSWLSSQGQKLQSALGAYLAALGERLSSRSPAESLPAGESMLPGS